jgi:hypothetical protein
MSFPKFSEWVSLREEVGTQAPSTSTSTTTKLGKKRNPRVNQIIATAAKSGKPDSAIDKAGADPSLDPDDVAIIGKAVSTLKGK